MCSKALGTKLAQMGFSLPQEQLNEVFKRFKELSEGKTAILISHRFSSVRMADRIVVLMDGAVEARARPRMCMHAKVHEQPILTRH